MKMGNPAIARLSRYERTADATPATYRGVAVKSIYFAALTILPAVLAFLFTSRTFDAGWIIFAAIAAPCGALVFGLIASFVPKTIPVTGSVYVVLMGLSVGFISSIFDMAYSGVVFAALLATCCVFGGMTVLYATGVIRVGKFFGKFMLSLLVGVALTQLVMFLVSLFSPALRVMFYGNGALAVIISAVMCVVASLMLLLDLNNITMIVTNGLDKQYEWRAAFGLITTLIWLYLEILRLVGRIASRKS